MVIPVFNAEAFLRQCLDSILAQAPHEIEVICIDDHSIDKSPEILSEYQARDKRVAVLHNSETLGAGGSRNLGMEYAHGDYLLFMDADDWLFPGSLGSVLAKAERHRADVLRCRASNYNNQTGKSSLSTHNALKRVPPFLFDRALAPRRSCAILSKVCVAPWGGLVRRGFLLENGIRFSGLACVNDRPFFWETVLKAQRIVFARDFLIHYRTNLGTSLVGRRIQNFACHFESYQLVGALCEDLPQRDRRHILDAELLDLAHWAARGAGTEYAGEIREMLTRFLDSMDRGPWDGRIEGTRWYRKLDRLRAPDG